MTTSKIPPTIVGAEEGIFAAIHVENGRMLWRSRTRDSVEAVAYGGDMVYLATHNLQNAPSLVRALRASDCKVLWLAMPSVDLQLFLKIALPPSV
jgi:hypothetical protein